MKTASGIMIDKDYKSLFKFFHFSCQQITFLWTADTFTFVQATGCIPCGHVYRACSGLWPRQEMEGTEVELQNRWESYQANDHSSRLCFNIYKCEMTTGYLLWDVSDNFHVWGKKKDTLTTVKPQVNLYSSAFQNKQYKVDKTILWYNLTQLLHRGSGSFRILWVFVWNDFSLTALQLWICFFTL